MEVQVCIRGCGKVGERCFRLLQYKEKAGMCFSDMDSGIKMYCGKTVYSVSESIERYHKGLICFFVISLEYSEKIREDMIKELLLGNVKEEHILLFPNRAETVYKIDSLADLKFIKEYCSWRPDFEKIYNYDNERYERNIFDIRCRLNENYDKEQYQIEITGGGYI